MKYVQLGTAVLMGLWSAGCASAPAPHERVASAQAAVRSAEELGARDMPQAALHLQLAQDQLERGKALIRDGDNREAQNMLLRAQADAELALAMARESKTRVAAQEAKARVQALRSGMAPGSAVGGGPAGAQKPGVTPPSQQQQQQQQQQQGPSQQVPSQPVTPPGQSTPPSPAVPPTTPHQHQP